MSSNKAKTTDENRIEQYELDLKNGLIAEVNLYRDDDFRFGPFIITVDVTDNMAERTGSAWTSTTTKDHIDHRTKKVVAEATGRAILNLPDSTIKRDEEERSEFRQSLQDIKDCIQDVL